MRKTSLAAIGRGLREGRLLGIAAVVILAIAGLAAVADAAGLDGIQGSGHVSAATAVEYGL